ncbi:uncharacterized protein L201_004507 [Kwoniella dendrophila CBS 6074]|uniref:Formin GTPase-binding domain-containing protein n=1 Tax=Kwoniella dendrophila CBS 6074 TaxID=1295534 RepID=A0AAX4JW44_9TREE
MSSIHYPSQSQPQTRRPSGSRPPPMVTPGIPVKADQAKLIMQGQGQQQQQFPHSQHSRSSNPSPHPSNIQSNVNSQLANHHRSSMPNPHPSDSQQHQQQQRLQKSNHASTVSSRPLPRTSQSSGPRQSTNDSFLRETSRTNITPSSGSRSMGPPRQPSANLAWGHQKLPSPRDSQQISSPHNNLRQSFDSTTMKESKSDVDMQFEHLLDSLQVPVTVRQKFATVSPDVKNSILLSTLNSNPTVLSSLGLPVPSTPNSSSNKVKKRSSTPFLRKTKSSNEVPSSPNQSNSPQVGKTYDVNGEGFVIVASPVTSPNLNNNNNSMMTPPLSGYNSGQRGQSMDLPRSVRGSIGPSTSTSGGSGSNSSRPLSALFSPSNSNNSVNSLGKSSGKGLGISGFGGGGGGEQPDSFIQWLNSHKGTDLNMDVGKAKKLRMLLRHENTFWVGQFIEMKGYDLILQKLKDLLDIEWREEQHDDQMLYELLRCVKALSTSEIGKVALRTHFPAPFPSLSTLLFSEKKPGDLASRQIIIELWLFLFDLFPLPAYSTPSSSSSSPLLPQHQHQHQHQSTRQPGNRPTSVRFDEKSASQIKNNTVNIVKEVRSLLLPDLPDPSKDHHEFVTKAHRPRIFKAWVGELSDICRDYFWIMCHASNTLWDLSEVDESLVEKPVAPGGATGGVEFEAMNYVTYHFKLLNALCKNQAIESKEDALKLHEDLMASGMDRILVTLRKASTTYYPTLHLELARYVSLLQDVCPNGKLPYLIGKMVGPPPGEVRRFDTPPSSNSREWLPMPAGVGR